MLASRALIKKRSPIDNTNKAYEHGLLVLLTIYLQLVDFLQCIQLSKISTTFDAIVENKTFSLKEGFISDNPSTRIYRIRLRRYFNDRRCLKTGGDDRSRTCDPLNANQVLSQLSYIPKSWLRGQDLNLRPLGYEPNELPDCSTPR